jgi:hypothetical protein
MIHRDLPMLREIGLGVRTQDSLEVRAWDQRNGPRRGTTPRPPRQEPTTRLQHSDRVPAREPTSDRQGLSAGSYWRQSIIRPSAGGGREAALANIEVHSTRRHSSDSAYRPHGALNSTYQ